MKCPAYTTQTHIACALKMEDVPVRICKVITSSLILVQRKSTNTVMTLRLIAPIEDQHYASALQTSVFEPIDAVVRLGGQYDESRHIHTNCAIVEANWPPIKPTPKKPSRISWFS